MRLPVSQATRSGSGPMSTLHVICACRRVHGSKVSNVHTRPVAVFRVSLHAADVPITYRRQWQRECITSHNTHSEAAVGFFRSESCSGLAGADIDAK
jgi:hypothetical protein